jgi:hypothetical protein
VTDCSSGTVDGQDGLEGYYYQYDHPLELDQRLVFARHEEAILRSTPSCVCWPTKPAPRPVRRISGAHHLRQRRSLAAAGAAGGPKPSGN